MLILEICNGYVRYIKRAFGNRVFVVFDVYDQITTKSTKRNRRCMHKNSATVRMAPDSWTVMTLPAIVTQDKFLGDNKNKSQLIKFLQEELKRANIMSQMSIAADADVEIVLKAIETASGSRNNKVVIVSEDTDVLTMLAARTPPNLEVFLLKPPSARVPDVVYSFESLVSRSACIRFHILFRHAFTGYDTTSAFFYRGKVKFCDLFEKSDDLHGFAVISANSCIHG
ncbi:unnamed protein product [Psylliodes chrysocephalus]|uniref:NYN domain-containing protein n=1 Tax=Psylliodes chrysocephalus TaxID=3402493 RepID=A0A9P0D2U9_9CUCU|nr:unnamed protein product [Psylliodes chrysocephala]